MRITDFTEKDLKRAEKLVGKNYEEERAANSALQQISTFPDLSDLAQNGLGVAAYDAEEMIGFLGAAVSERFGAPRAFCPVHGHGAVKKNRAEIYSRLYGAAAQKWVQANALTHEVALFSHDDDALDSFFYNVFGACVMYAIMDIDSSGFRFSGIDGIEIKELEDSRYKEILPLQNGLWSHLRKSPVFLPYLEEDEKLFSRIKDKRYFTAMKDNKIIAHIRVQNDAGNFVTTLEDTVNISGAFMKPEYRGSGIYEQLLAFMVQQMKKEGYKRISVDFETYNPNAMKFWAKNFIPYTTTLTRKIEPKILEPPDF